jgi:hypothetical protein
MQAELGYLFRFEHALGGALRPSARGIRSPKELLLRVACLSGRIFVADAIS